MNTRKADLHDQEQLAEVKKVSDAELNLTQIVDQDIETIVALRMRAERKVNRHQRTIERFTQTIGRPRFLYFIIDLQAEAMKENVDPHAAITSLNQSLQEAAKDLD